MQFFMFTQPPKVLTITHDPGKHATRATVPLNTTHVSTPFTTLIAACEAIDF